MIPLPQYQTCTNCDLYQNAKSVGMATRFLAGNGGRKALFVVGDRPGTFEDSQNRAFVGPMGAMFEKVFVAGAGLADAADIYVTNAVRCVPVKGSTPSPGCYTKCRSHLDADYLELRKHYDEIVVLGLGAGASKSIAKSSLESVLNAQGLQYTLGGEKVRCFWTYNPANLFSDKNPSLILAVDEHLTMLKTYLTEGYLPMMLTPTPFLRRCDTYPESAPSILSFDIESYGCVKGYPQTQFHPLKAMTYDGVPREMLVQTAAASWRSPDGKLVSAFWDLQNPDEAPRMVRFFETAYDAGCRWLLGKNLPFDMTFIRAWTDEMRALFDRKWNLWDLSVTSYLQSENRPETSLKSLAKVLGVADYDSDEVQLKKGEKYEDTTDERLAVYNVKDTEATLISHEKLVEQIRRQFGPDSPKLKPYCWDWYSRLLWFAVESSESGVSMDAEAILRLQERQSYQADRILRFVKAKWDACLAGKGSAKWKERFITEAAVLANLINDKRLKRTDKTKVVSHAEENLNLLLGRLDPDSDEAKIIRLWQKFVVVRDNVSRYTRPLLEGRKKPGEPVLNRSSCVLANRAHPSWFVVPGKFEDNSGGGTKQGRITCRDPGLLNLSKPVKKTLWTRFDPGVLIETDLSQIELRVGALITGDPVMLDDYRNNRDRHTATGVIVLREILNYLCEKGKTSAFGVTRDWLEQTLAGEVTKSTPGFAVWRQLGKTLNFLVLFKGGAKKAQETACRDCGVLLPLEVWERIVWGFNNAHPVFRAEQDKWIKHVGATGYAELPIIGQSRWFLGGQLATDAKINEIANQPVQTLAANTLIDGADALRAAMREDQMESVMNLYIYDAGYAESPIGEAETVCNMCQTYLTEVDFWRRLEAHFGQTCPLECETHIIRRRGC